MKHHVKVNPLGEMSFFKTHGKVWQGVLLRDLLDQTKIPKISRNLYRLTSRARAQSNSVVKWKEILSTLNATKLCRQTENKLG
jgi:hypothetical protein